MSEIGGIYSRPECIFMYCDSPETCKPVHSCRHTVEYEVRLKTLCKCGHTLGLHDDQAVCRALVEGKKSCQCMQYHTI